MNKYAHIINKDREDQLLTFNECQEDIYETLVKRDREGKKKWFLILKARQLGMSTFVENLGMTLNTIKDKQSMFIMTHEEKSSNNLYAMSHYTYDNFPDFLKAGQEVVKDNQSMMELSNGSKLQVMVASPNSKGTGRGQTFTFAHLSEYDWWSGDAPSILAGILSACTKDSIVFIETTANGCANFKKLWDEANAKIESGDDSGWVTKFYAWWSEPKYRVAYTGFELNKEELELRDRFNLDLEQIAWRRMQIETVFSGDKILFNQEFPSTPEEAFISSGECIFDLNSINNRKLDIRENKVKYRDKGYFKYRITFDEYSNSRRISDIEWVSDEVNGVITIYKYPVKRKPYVLSIDPSGVGSDYTAIVMLDNQSCEQVVTLHQQKANNLDISIQAYCLGVKYNKALICSEINYAPDVLSNIIEFGYENLYVTQDAGTNMAVRMSDKYGFRTTTVTRPYVINMLKEYINTSATLINDYRILLEAENFVRTSKMINGKAIYKEQANIGKHDDLLMALGIALYVRSTGQQTFQLLPDEDAEKKSSYGVLDWIYGKGKTNEKEDSYLTYE